MLIRSLILTLHTMILCHLIRRQSSSIVISTILFIHTEVLIHLIDPRSLTIIFYFLQSTWQWSLTFLLIFFYLLQLLLCMTCSLFISHAFIFLIFINICVSYAISSIATCSMNTVWSLWSLTSNIFLISKFVKIIWVAIVMYSFASYLFLIDAFLS